MLEICAKPESTSSDGHLHLEQCRRQKHGLQTPVRSQAGRSQVVVVVVVAAGARSEGGRLNRGATGRAKLPPSRPSQLSSHLLRKVRRRLGRRRQRRQGNCQRPQPSPLVLLHPCGTDIIIWHHVGHSCSVAFLQHQLLFDDKSFCSGGGNNSAHD